MSALSIYEKYENIIVEWLENEDWDVSVLPPLSQLNEPQVRPRIYVIFAESSLSDRPNHEDFAQDENYTFQLSILARKRDGENGVFAVAEEILRRLLKQRLPGTDQNVTISSFGYVDGIQNGWQYNLRFSFPRVRVRYEQEDDPILITKIEQKYNSNETV